MLNKEKKVKRIVITASNKREPRNNNEGPKEKNNTNARQSFSLQQMEVSRYRLSRVRNNITNNRVVETENREPFCTTFFRNNPEMLDIRPPSIKLIEYYEKLGINEKCESRQTKKSQKNSKSQICNDCSNKSTTEEIPNNTDSFSLSCISFPSDFSSSYTRREKIQLLSQMLPLESKVHGESSFEFLRAHVMLAHYYNRTRKPQPAIRHLNEAQKIQSKISKTLNSDKSNFISKAPSKSSRKASPSSSKSRKRSPKRQSEFNQQFPDQQDFFYLNEEQENEIDDEISIEFANAHLMIAMEGSTPTSSKSKHIKDATIYLSRFDQQFENNTDNDAQNNDPFVYQKTLAKARLLFVQKKFAESAKFYENVLSNIDAISNSENNDNERKSVKSETKNLNEAARLDELEESASIKVEIAENIKMIVQSQINIIKDNGRTIKNNNDEEIRYDKLFDDIDFALDLYCEARDSYYDTGFNDEEEDCISQIQQLENYKVELYNILEQEQKVQQERQLREQEEEENFDENIKIETKDSLNRIENTVEINFGSSDSLEEKENKIETALNGERSPENSDNLNSKDTKNFQNNESKLNVDALTPLLENNEKSNIYSTDSRIIQEELEYGSDENDEFETNRIKIENNTKIDKKDDSEIENKPCIKNLAEITDSLMSDGQKKTD